MPRLVIFELHHLGDAVMALPFLRGARRKFSVTIVSRPPVAEFLRSAISGIEIIEATEGWLGRASQARKLRCGETDAAACVWADTRAHILMALTGAGRRAGFPMSPRNYYASEIPWRKRRLVSGRLLSDAIGLFHPLLTLPLTRATSTQHHMEDWKQLGETLEISCEDSPPWIEAGLQPIPALADFLTGQQGRRTVLIHPGGRLPEKRWPWFEDLLRRLAAQADIAALVVAPPGEPFPKTFGPHQRTFPSGSWPELFSLFSATDVVICNDSFASHLAAALGKPVVALFGSGNPDWFSPWRSRQLVVVPEGRALYPLVDHGAPPGSVHLESIPVDLVESRLRTALIAG